MSIQSQPDISNPLLAGNAGMDDSNFSVDKSTNSIGNNNVALLSVKHRSNSDPTHKATYDSTANLPNLQHTHFATGLMPILGDEVAHGMRPNYTSLSSHKTTLQQAAGSQILAVFLLCSVSLGVGVFVLPGILLITGIGPGIVMLAFYAFLALYTQLIVLECAEKANAKGYEQLASYSLGRLGEFLLAFFMTLSLLMGNCGHIQTVGELLHDLIDWFYTDQYEDYSFGWKKTAILYCVMLSLTLPWLFQRSLRGLSGVGTLSVITVIVTAISLTIVCAVKLVSGEGATADKAPEYGFQKITTNQFWVTDFWRACPAIAFVYTPLLELFPVYTELNHKDASKTRPSVYIATLICFVVYTVVSVVVVMTYGTDIQSNSLYNVPPDNYWITFLCFMLVIVITLLYPVINYPMLNALETIMDLCGCCRLKGYDVIDDDMFEDAFADPVNTNIISKNYVNNDTEYDMTNISLLYTLVTPSIWSQYIIYHRRDVLSILSVFIVIGIDIGVTDLDDLFGLCGSLGLSFVCYIFPCIIWIIAKKKWQKESWIKFVFINLKSPQFVFTIFVLLFSTAVMLYSTLVIMLNIL